MTTCPRCNGRLVVESGADFIMGCAADLIRCLNCGHRDDAVAAANRLAPPRESFAIPHHKGLALEGRTARRRKVKPYHRW